jgi:hypothetical protein
MYLFVLAGTINPKSLIPSIKNFHDKLNLGEKFSPMSLSMVNDTFHDTRRRFKIKSKMLYNAILL